MTDGYLGHRVNNHEDFWAQVGVFWPWTGWDEEKGELKRWFVRPPCGHHFFLAGPEKPAHFVEEHDDGMITVRAHPPADPKNSNSIQCPECSWHGYIDHGIWKKI